jgi:hypothetical protein
MSNKLTLVREWARALLIDQFNYKVYANRNIDSREDQEFFNVFIGGVEFVPDGLLVYGQADLVIGYHIANVESDGLDVMSEQILNLILSTKAPDEISGVRPVAIEYGEESQASYSRVYVRFTVIY